MMMPLIKCCRSRRLSPASLEIASSIPRPHPPATTRRAGCQDRPDASTSQARTWPCSFPPIRGFVEEVFDVEVNDQTGGGPGQQFYPERIRELAHLLPVAREQHQGNDGKGELQTEHDLAEDEQIAGALRSVNGRDQDRRHDRYQASDQPAQPRTQTDVQETF